MSEATILICDDEPSLRELMRISLPPELSVTEASSASEAIELAERVRPDVVLLDVMMPGASGLTVLEWIRNHPELKNAAVVIISAFASESDQLAALDAGATAFLKKPFDPLELEALVEEMLAPRR
ncbi:MAG TPA: response regulator [Gaiellaceae bacterium]